MSAKWSRSTSSRLRPYSFESCMSFILAHDRRRVLHFNVTENPTADWTARQIVEAFPDDTAPRYLVRDRAGIYGHVFTARVDGLGIRQVDIFSQSLAELRGGTDYRKYSPRMFEPRDRHK